MFYPSQQNIDILQQMHDLQNKDAVPEEIGDGIFASDLSEGRDNVDSYYFDSDYDQKKI